MGSGDEYLKAGPSEESLLLEEIHDQLEQIKQLSSDLSVAREQLAEMRAAVEYTLIRLEPLLELMPDDRKPREWVDKLKKALSAAPAGGRVRKLEEALERIKGYAKQHARHDSADALSLDWVWVHSVAEDALSADEEWPRECPRCGAAGGSELGPCPMCKGAGFVDEE